MDKLKNLSKNILLVISSITLMFIIAETGKRAYDKIVHGFDFFGKVYRNDPSSMFIYTDRGRRNRPFATNTFIHPQRRKVVHVKINSLGFRYDELSPEKKNEFRILILGDSITQGMRFNRDEVYVGQLEKLLNTGNDTGIKFQVINAGVGDIGLAEEVEILRENGIKAQPDLVGIGFYLNDSRAPWGVFVEKGYNYFILKHSRFIRWLYRRIFVERYVRLIGKSRVAWVETFNERKWVNDRETFYRMIEEAESDWGAAWRDSSWKFIEKKLDEALKLAEEHNFRIFLFSFPVSVQVEAEFFDNKPQRILKKICEERNIPFLDLLPVMRENREKNLFYDQCHPTFTGNTIIAEALYKFLKNSRLLDLAMAEQYHQQAK
ncbi:MAG: SGNH/GDSL hydrolase family protein [Deferribacteres bacterium]|nr:SGNH/GDSL hydrolase family protein [Deferribacteres bacterium]